MPEFAVTLVLSQELESVGGWVYRGNALPAVDDEIVVETLEYAVRARVTVSDAEKDPPIGATEIGEA